MKIQSNRGKFNIFNVIIPTILSLLVVVSFTLFSLAANKTSRTISSDITFTNGIKAVITNVSPTSEEMSESANFNLYATAYNGEDVGDQVLNSLNFSNVHPEDYITIKNPSIEPASNTSPYVLRVKWVILDDKGNEYSSQNLSGTNVVSLPAFHSTYWKEGDDGYFYSMATDENQLEGLQVHMNDATTPSTGSIPFFNDNNRNIVFESFSDFDSNVHEVYFQLIVEAVQATYYALDDYDWNYPVEESYTYKLINNNTELALVKYVGTVSNFVVPSMVEEYIDPETGTSYENLPVTQIGLGVNLLNIDISQEQYNNAMYNGLISAISKMLGLTDEVAKDYILLEIYCGINGYDSDSVRRQLNGEDNEEENQNNNNNQNNYSSAIFNELTESEQNEILTNYQSSEYEFTSAEEEAKAIIMFAYGVVLRRVTDYDDYVIAYLNSLDDFAENQIESFGSLQQEELMALIPYIMEFAKQNLDQIDSSTKSTLVSMFDSSMFTTNNISALASGIIIGAYSSAHSDDPNNQDLSYIMTNAYSGLVDPANVTMFMTNENYADDVDALFTRMYSAYLQNSTAIQQAVQSYLETQYPDEGNRPSVSGFMTDDQYEEAFGTFASENINDQEVINYFYANLYNSNVVDALKYIYEYGAAQNGNNGNNGGKLTPAQKYLKFKESKTDEELKQYIFTGYKLLLSDEELAEYEEMFIPPLRNQILVPYLQEYLNDNTTSTYVTLVNKIQVIDTKSARYIQTIEVPSSVTKIGAFAFANLSNLTNVELIGNEKTLAYGSFSNCLNLISVNTTNVVENNSNLFKVAENVFQNCSKFKLLTLANSSVVPQLVNYNVNRTSYLFAISYDNSNFILAEPFSEIYSKKYAVIGYADDLEEFLESVTVEIEGQETTIDLIWFYDLADLINDIEIDLEIENVQQNHRYYCCFGNTPTILTDNSDDDDKDSNQVTYEFGMVSIGSGEKLYGITKIKLNQYWGNNFELPTVDNSGNTLYAIGPKAIKNPYNGEFDYLQIKIPNTIQYIANKAFLNYNIIVDLSENNATENMIKETYYGMIIQPTTLNQYPAKVLQAINNDSKVFIYKTFKNYDYLPKSIQITVNDVNYTLYCAYYERKQYGNPLNLGESFTFGDGNYVYGHGESTINYYCLLGTTEFGNTEFTFTHNTDGEGDYLTITGISTNEKILIIPESYDYEGNGTLIPVKKIRGNSLLSDNHITDTIILPASFTDTESISSSAFENNYNINYVVLKGQPISLHFNSVNTVFVLPENYGSFSSYYENENSWNGSIYCFKYLTELDNTLPNSVSFISEGVNITRYFAWYEDIYQFNNSNRFEYISGQNKTGNVNQYYFARTDTSQFAEITPYEVDFILSDDYSYYKLTCTGGNSVNLDLSAYEMHNGLPVKEIASGAFANNTNIGVVTLPSSIEIIGDGAFSGCTSLSSININEINLRIIGNNAFKDDERLGDITLPATIESIGNFAFNSLNGPNIYISANSNIPTIGVSVIGDGTRTIIFPDIDLYFDAMQNADWQEYSSIVTFPYTFHEGDNLANYFVYTINGTDYQLGWYSHPYGATSFGTPYSSNNPYVQTTWVEENGEWVEVPYGEPNIIPYETTFYGKIIS